VMVGVAAATAVYRRKDRSRAGRGRARSVE
jgi:hypothetical protein